MRHWLAAFPAECPSGPGMTVGTAKQADWQWLAARGEREAEALMEAPLGTFMAVKDELLAELQRRSEFELATPRGAGTYQADAGVIRQRGLQLGCNSRFVAIGAKAN